MGNIIEKDSDFFIKRFNSQRKILLESFVIYYGEKYRNSIEKYFNKTDFIFYLNDTSNINISSKIQYKSKALEEFNEATKRDISFVLSHNASCCISNYDNIEKNDFYVIVLNLSNNNGDKTLIHEINHTIGNETLFLQDEYLCRKSGFKIFLNNIADKNECKLDEIFNELSARKIYEIFKSLGGNIIEDILERKIENIYFKNFYLVKDIFLLLENEFKLAKVTLNKNIFVNTIGIENYQSILQLLSKYYSVYSDIIMNNSISSSVLKERNRIIENIENYMKNASNLDLESYISSLEKTGYKIRKLGIENG